MGFQEEGLHGGNPALRHQAGQVSERLAEQLHGPPFPTRGRRAPSDEQRRVRHPFLPVQASPSLDHSIPSTGRANNRSISGNRDSLMAWNLLLPARRRRPSRASTSVTGHEWSSSTRSHAPSA